MLVRIHFLCIWKRLSIDLISSQTTTVSCGRASYPHVLLLLGCGVDEELSALADERCWWGVCGPVEANEDVQAVWIETI